MDGPSDLPYPISVANRLKRLPPYLFGQINDLKARRRKAGHDIIDLGMGNPTDPPPAAVIQKLCQAVGDPRNHRYSVSRGVVNLRREVAKRYGRKYGVDLDPDGEVIATIGSKEGFSHLCLALMGPGDTALVPNPAFPIHVYAVALAGANVISLEMADPQAYLSSIAHMAEHLHPRPKVLILNYPHNPTAATIDQDFFVEVVALAKRFGLMVIHDFAYSDVCFDGWQAPSFLSVPGAVDVGVELTTMSKGFGMAGWRVGFCVGNRHMVKALGDIKGYYDYGIFQAVQIAAIIAMRECEDNVAEQAAEYQRRRDVLCSGLNRIGWPVQPPRASMFVWVPIPEPYKGQYGSMEFAMKLMEEADVAAAPGRAFGTAGEGYFRFALVENSQRLRQAVRQLGRALAGRPVKADVSS